MGRENVEEIICNLNGVEWAVTTKTKLTATEEFNKMITRRTVDIQLIDDEVGLPVELSLVASFQNIITEDSNEVTIQQLLMDSDVGKQIDSHNLKRRTVINLDIQQRTGQEVRLTPIKLKQLRWVVK